jgi:hypothetical protein
MTLLYLDKGQDSMKQRKLHIVIYCYYHLIIIAAAVVVTKEAL